MSVEQQGEGEAVHASAYHSYPPPLATYEDVVTSRDLFMDTLKKLHLSMATKFMIPIVGGRDLDLHRLFVEVTSRGGIAKVVSDKKWKEVTGVFKFPSSATNASFILRKYYVSLIYHYEQIYLFKAKCWSPSPLPMLQGGMQNLSTNMPPPPKSTPQVSSLLSGSPVVCGVIDGKFESGYLITVRIGCDELKGVFYQVPNSEVCPLVSSSIGGGGRRKRRKKSEMRKRDPAHPKPNRSGYNFFFAEQHARLKPHYHGRDREISRIIGESWNNLQLFERRVYQEKAVKDKERYKTEMEVYRERLRMRGDEAVPQVNNLQLNSSTTNLLFEDNDQTNINNNDSDTLLKNVNIEIMTDEAAFDLQTRIDDDDDDDDDDERNVIEDDNALLVEHGIIPSNADEQDL